MEFFVLVMSEIFDQGNREVRLEVVGREHVQRWLLLTEQSNCFTLSQAVKSEYVILLECFICQS